MKPRTQYTKSGRINIAYQVIGTGDVDIVYIPGWISNIDLMWECPQLVHFFEGLTKIARLILFDKRGTGLSDRIMEISPIEDRMDDIRAVMDAVDSERAFLFGHSEGGSVSALFSATYPERVEGLITFGVFAKRRWSSDYPWAPTDEERQKTYDMIENDWGSGEMDLVALAPSMKDDHEFMDWLARYFRSGASPSAALALTKMNTQVDIIHILDAIKVPSLFMCRTNDIDVKVEESKYMALRVKGSKVVEFEGDDHLFWAGNVDEVISEIKTFVTEVKPNLEIDKRFFTLLSGEIQSPPSKLALISNSKELITQMVQQYRGSLIFFEQNEYIASFEGPGKGVNSALEIRAKINDIGLKVKQAINIGEIEVDKENVIEGLAIDGGKEILDHTLANEINVSNTAHNLLSGTGINTKPVLSIKPSDIPINVLIYQVEEPIKIKTQHARNEELSIHNHSFLENVLESIEVNMSNTQYGVNTLCKDLGIGERQLQRKLKSITNKSPNKVIRSFRLHKAKEMIINDKMSMTDVAFASGFSSPAYFSSCFKKEFGISPSELN